MPVCLQRQRWQQGDPEAGGHQVLDGDEIIGGEPDLGLEVSASRQVEELVAALRTPRDPGRVPMAGQGEGSCQRTVERSDEVEDVAAKAELLEARRLLRLAIAEHQGDVGLT